MPINYLNINWDEIDRLVSKARILRGTFDNAAFISDSDKQEIYEKIVNAILVLLTQS